MSMENKIKKDGLRSFLKISLDKDVDGLFSFAHAIMDTESGDITPDQSGRLDEIKEELLDLIIEQTEQNLPAPLPVEEALYEYSVTVCRTASACREILVSAPNEQIARERASEEAGDFEYSEKEADYTIEGVTKLDKIN